MKILAYLKSTLRLTTAIFLSVCAFTLVVGGGWLAYNYWEKSQAKKYESIKFWTADVRSILQFSLAARTKLVDRQFFIQVAADGYPEYLKNPALFAKNVDKEILLNFSDKDGFKVFSKSIPINALSRTVDGTGKPTGLSYEGMEYMNVQTYASMATLDVQWTVDTSIPAAPTPVADPKATAEELDHCAPNLSKAERLERLAQHGALRQTGDGSYSVGNRSLTFFTFDNSLLNCQ